MMTGYGIVMPVFARRLDELGAGMAALGFMTMAFVLFSFLEAGSLPCEGTLTSASKEQTSKPLRWGT